MERLDSTFEEACRIVGEYRLMFAERGEEVSLERLALWLERAQEEAVDTNGEQHDAVKLAIERLKGW